MNSAQAFSVFNTLALLSWVALIVAPRWPLLLTILRYGIVSVLALAYAALIFVYFFRVEGGGFSSLDQVKRLFSSDPVALAGWLHYLAFDLTVGLALAARMDKARLSRWIQAPILLATFMFGPVGWLIGQAFTLPGQLERAS